jgi:hypothetical protein
MTLNVTPRQNVDAETARWYRDIANAVNKLSTLITTGTLTATTANITTANITTANITTSNVTTETVTTLHATTIDSVTSINSGPLAGNHNRLINSSFVHDQRNEGNAKTFTAGAALSYCVDRWYGYCTGANVTGQRIAGAGNSQYRYRFTGAASVTGIGFGQRIKDSNSYDLNGRTTTVGIDLANSLLTTVTWTAYYANTANTFGTLASPTRTQIATGTFTVTSTVTRYYAQISNPAAATTGIELVVSVGAQTSGTWTIGEPQWVPGSANEIWIEKRLNEFDLCLPHYEKSYNAGVVPGTAALNGGDALSVAINISDFYDLGKTPFKAKKYAAPTMALYSSGDGSASTFYSYTAGGNQGNSQAQRISQTNFYFNCSNTALTATNISGTHWTAEAEL